MKYIVHSIHCYLPPNPCQLHVFSFIIFSSPEPNKCCLQAHKCMIILWGMSNLPGTAMFPRMAASFSSHQLLIVPGGSGALPQPMQEYWTSTGPV